MNLIVWGGGTLAAIILFGSSAAMLIIAFRSKHKIAIINNDINLEMEKNLSPENRLLAAFEYVSCHEVEFINFCRENRINYEKEYRKAVLTFYDSIH